VGDTEFGERGAACCLDGVGGLDGSGLKIFVLLLDSYGLRLEVCAGAQDEFIAGLGGG